MLSSILKIGVLQTCCSLEQFVLFSNNICVVGIIIVVLLVGEGLSSLSLVKIVLNNASWNSLAKIAACFSGRTTSFSLLQSQVMLHFPVQDDKTLVTISTINVQLVKQHTFFVFLFIFIFISISPTWQYLPDAPINVSLLPHRVLTFLILNDILGNVTIRIERWLPFNTK